MTEKKRNDYSVDRITNELIKQRDLLITNIVLACQVPSVPISPRETDLEEPGQPLRARVFAERLQDMGIDELTADEEGNPIGIIKGSDASCAPIVLAAHMDTVFPVPEDSYCTVSSGSITGPGLLDNSLSIGVLLSIPHVLRNLGLSFRSDIIIAAFNESLGKSNLRGARSFIKEWKRPIRAALCLEGGELGRVNYFSDAMTRLEIRCAVTDEASWDIKHGANTILVLNEIINRIMEIRVPQRPETRITIGTVQGGVKFGNRAMTSRLGLEIHSTSDAEATRILGEIQDIATSVACEQQATVEVKQISAVGAANLGYSHPLVKNALSLLADLDVKPLIVSSESELSIFLSAGIPAITIGLAAGTNYHLESATMDINSLFTGVAQLIALLGRIDEGICDEN